MNRDHERRLRRLEGSFGPPSVDIRRISEDELDRRIEAEYSVLRRKHGSLSQAIIALRGRGSTDEAALADLIEWDTAEQRA